MTSAVEMILGIDAGGTFTDFVLLQENGAGGSLRIHKLPSTPEQPEQAILQGIEELGLGEAISKGVVKIIHGSTVATNAVLENKLAKTAFVTNRGFGDMLSLGRQTRPALYQLNFDPVEAPVPPAYCFETGGRISSQGQLLDPLELTDLQELVQQLANSGVDAVAINQLFSFVDDSHESRIENAIAEKLPELFVCRSSAILPEYREYERGIATWLNAALGPVMSRYIKKLHEGINYCPLEVMQSSGETLSADKAADLAVNLLLSGPAAGLAAVEFLGKALEQDNIVSFDMGGTSTDVALIQEEIKVSNEGSICDYPVAVPMVDMHTIGAGGGSIAYIDEGGMLCVGPESAGAAPGPACYGRGGRRATVTDANLLLGRICADSKLAGSMPLDLAAARLALEELALEIGISAEATAAGIVSIANEHMATALRMISVQRGHDVRSFLLASFGGAGGLHVCALADLMQMKRAIVPIHGGVLSALGMIVAKNGRQYSRTVNLSASAGFQARLDAEFSRLQEQAAAAQGVEANGQQGFEVVKSLDMRYQGQSFTLNVVGEDIAESMLAFADLHLVRFGYSLQVPVEVVNVRLKRVALSQAISLPQWQSQGLCNNSRTAEVFGCSERVQILARKDLEAGTTIEGPAIITETAATTWVEPQWVATIDKWGNILLDKN